MEIKELVPKLVKHYQRCIDEMPEIKWLKFIAEKEVLCGICHCANARFDTFIYGGDFVDDFTNGDERLVKYPYNAKSYSEAKELLQIRLNRLKDFL